MPQALLQVGEAAPNFTLLNQDGKQQSLSDYRGKTVALYFYHRDNTPGCTRPACSLRDGYQKLINAGITVLGISPDSPENHIKFKKKFDLPFTLLCDPNKGTAKEYGALRKFFKAFIPKRVTFIINSQGVITHVITKVALDAHADQIIRTLTADK